MHFSLVVLLFSMLAVSTTAEVRGKRSVIDDLMVKDNTAAVHRLSERFCHGESICSWGDML